MGGQNEDHELPEQAHVCILKQNYTNTYLAHSDGMSLLACKNATFDIIGLHRQAGPLKFPVKV